MTTLLEDQLTTEYRAEDQSISSNKIFGSSIRNFIYPCVYPYAVLTQTDVGTPPEVAYNLQAAGSGNMELITGISGLHNVMQVGADGDTVRFTVPTWYIDFTRDLDFLLGFWRTTHADADTLTCKISYVADFWSPLESGNVPVNTGITSAGTMTLPEFTCPTACEQMVVVPGTTLLTGHMPGGTLNQQGELILDVEIDAYAGTHAELFLMNLILKGYQRF